MPEDALPMNMPSDTPRRYRFVFRGECGDMFAGLIGGVTLESGHGYTCVVAAVRDGSEFYGLLDRFQDLALHPVSISELGAGCLDARSQALIRLAGLAACDAGQAALAEHVVTALHQGVSPDEIVGALTVLHSTVGTGRITAATSAVRHVLGEAPWRIREQG
jgi:alkylhydroperoxidase/carboxymuconolactone decarboxylase family protein YurZ